MSIHYNDTVATARLQKVVDAIDGGSGPGKLVIGTTAMNGGSTGLLVEIVFPDPCGTIVLRTLTFDGTPIDTMAIAAGLAARAELRDSADTVVANGLTVGLTGSGANIIMDTTALTVSRPVRLVSASIVTP